MTRKGDIQVLSYAISASAKARQIGILAAAAVLALAAILAFGGTPAVADFLHRASFSGPSELESPRRAAVEQATGNLFVVNSAKDSIAVFQPEGTSGSLLTEFGAGELDEPYGLAIEEAGGQTAVYVSDAGNGRIVRFLSDEQETPGFTVDATYESPLKGNGADEVSSFASPLALLPNGDLWVADRGSNLVKRFDSTGAHVAGSNFDGSTSPGGAFTGLLDVAANSAGDLYVVDSTGDVSQQLGTSRVERFDATGAHQATLTPVGPNQRPATVAVNPADGSVAVSGEQDAVYRDQAPTLHFFDSANAPLEDSGLENNQYETVQGLAFRDGAFDLLYVVTDFGSYFGSPFGTPGIEVYEDAPLPTVSIDPVDPSSVTATSASVSGSVDPEGLETSWRFEYRPAGAADWSVTAPVSAGAGTDPVAVQAELENLVPGAEYLVRLRATNEEGTNFSGERSFSTDAVAPAIASTLATPRADGARLRAVVDPGGAATGYRFEYGPTTAYGQSTEQRTIPGGNSPANLSEVIAGLDPGTTYHFRVVAENAAGSDSSADSTFTTLPPPPAGEACPNEPIRLQQDATHLPHCMAYELVSPARKFNGGVVFGQRAADDGEAMSFGMNTATSDEDGAYPLTPYMARRTASGWESRSSAPPGTVERRGSGGTQAWTVDFSANLERGLLFSNEPIDPADAQPIASGNHDWGWDAFGVRPFAKETSWLTRPAPDRLAAVIPGGRDVGYGDWTEDGRHLVFTTTRGLTSDAPDHGPEHPSPSLYESDDGVVRYAGILPDGTPEQASTVPATGYSIAFALADSLDPSQAVSEDGRRLFWTRLPSSPPTALYLREDGERTVAVSASRRADTLGQEYAAAFMGATADGAHAYFWAAQPLTEDADEAGIYRYDAGTEELHFEVALPSFRLTENPYLPRSDDFARLTADGQKLVFSSDASISPEAVGAQKYLYVLEGGAVELVAPISPESATDPAIDPRLRLSPDSRFLTFSSSRSLTPAHTSGLEAIYIHDLASGETRCASCRADSIPSEQDAEIRVALLRFGALVPAQASNPRNLIAGGRVFFQTRDGLVPEDLNHSYDVYEYDFADDALRLVSSGTGTGTELADTSADGRSVFLLTTQSLAPQDTDGGAADIYVARAGGGFPAPPAPPQPCAGEACQGAAGEAPELPAIGSLGLDGDDAAPARLTLVGQKQTNPGVVVLTLRTSGSGRLGAEGPEVRKSNRAASRAGTHKLTVRLRSQALERLRERGPVQAKVVVTFQPHSGDAVRRAMQVKFQRQAGADRKGGAR